MKTPQTDAHPWRCWERKTLAGVLNGPEQLLVRVALEDSASGIYQSEFRWPALDRLGPNDFHGEYAQVTLRFGAVRWSFEMAAGEGGACLLLVRALHPDAARDVRVRLETFYQVAGGQVVTCEEEVIARRGGRAWRVWSPSPSAFREGATITAPLARPFVAVIEPAADPGARLESRTAASRTRSGADSPVLVEEQRCVEQIAEARRRYLARFAHVPPKLWWVYAAVAYGIGWNMIWAADRAEPLQVCSRDWCVHGNYGPWVLFNWDTFLLASAAAEYDAALAHQIVGPQLAVQTPEGLVPGVASPLGISADRGMPPVAAFGLWGAYQRSGDETFVTDYYDALRRYHAWWLRNRDGNRDGLLEWGSNPTAPAHPQWQSHTLWASRYETGMDNHPMWDNVRFNEETCTQEQNDVGLSALYALDSACLSRMAAVLGRTREADAYRREAAEATEHIEQELWNDAQGLWLSRGWDGAWNDRASPTSFYPIFLPGVQPTHIDRAIDGHLLDARRFGGRYMLPVCPRDDPAYPEQYYVRGRIWPPQTLLVHAALREAGREAAAAALARGALETMRMEWLERGHLHENYNAETADGDDTAESDPLYSFGIMLALTAWNHYRGLLLDGGSIDGGLEALAPYLDADGRLRRMIEPMDAAPAPV